MQASDGLDRENKVDKCICDLFSCNWQVFKAASEASATSSCWETFSWKLKLLFAGPPKLWEAHESFGGLVHRVNLLAW